MITVNFRWLRFNHADAGPNGSISSDPGYHFQFYLIAHYGRAIE
ncbi:hypothetical protein X768_23890 [Mesorhizobium sp. LSJC265A00]|nr:hypothetical protein X768_23890 [Mesorhizobium sp. LSJC265A00]ESY02040.1 hypothetical protein X753_25020 [Mesorhizobium sp. LNJC399B00]ESY18261.1 hypothetical protein X751_16805 [Mesorhizobium sp. LNJC395A00]